MHIILIISFISQVQVDLGIANHVWQEKSAAIATGINGLGDKFKPKLRAAWLAYIRETHPDGQGAEPDIMGTARWRLMIELLMLMDCMLANPPWWMSQLASFLH